MNPFRGVTAFFGSDPEEEALRAAMEASLQNDDDPTTTARQHQHRGPPPASAQALQDIPTIRVTAADLWDAANRECCICGDVHALGSDVWRLPCAHMFHVTCIRPWLAHTACTCPVCRYELPTEDATYEVGRRQRMAQRKPRLARHDLQRLTVKQLLALRRRQPNDDNNDNDDEDRAFHTIVDRNDLIEYLIESKSIELIAAPEPVQYSLSTLQHMTVSQLRRVMNDEAGVFFDTAKDGVIEKNDMIRIFLASGRLQLLTTSTPEEEEEADTEKKNNNDDNINPEETRYNNQTKTNENDKDDDSLDTKPSAMATTTPPSRTPLVETVTDYHHHNQEEDDVRDGNTDIDERTNRNIVMEEVPSYDDDVDVRTETNTSTSSLPVVAETASPTSTLTTENTTTANNNKEPNQLRPPSSTTRPPVGHATATEEAVVSSREPQVTSTVLPDTRQDAECDTTTRFHHNIHTAADLHHTTDNATTTTSNDDPEGNLERKNNPVGEEEETEYVIVAPPESSVTGTTNDVSQEEVPASETSTATATTHTGPAVFHASRSVESLQPNGVTDGNSPGSNVTAPIAATDDDGSDGTGSEEEGRRSRKRPLPPPLSSSSGISQRSESILQSRLNALSISELRTMGHNLSVDLSDCIERQEMICRLASVERDAGTTTSFTSSDNRNGGQDAAEEPVIDAALFHGWSISEIRGVARLLQMEIHNATVREDMVDALCRGTVARPYAGRFLRALVPLVGLSVPQLRAVARHRHINLAGCLEKEELLARLVETNMAGGR